MGSNPGDVDVSELLTKLTLEEKISLLAGVDWWRTPVIKRPSVFVPHIKFTDGPNGARGESYVSGIKASCFPCGTCVGATFDADLAYRVGGAVAKEAKTKSAVALLGPTMNVIRSPLGGRNYETFSEDPFMLGILGAAYVRGCQAEGIAATPKHFVANDAENRRTKLSVEVDEQTLREIYLRPFQMVMKLSDPWCFMTSYNKVNGTYVPDSRRLVQDVLREEWGFKGTVVSDWAGTYSTAPGIEAGVDIEMPGPPKWRTKDAVTKAIKAGTLSQAKVDASARRVLELAKRLGCFEYPDEPPERAVEDAARDELIKDVGANGLTVLKNEQVLPIPEGSTVAVIGQHATSIVLGGGGSARVDAMHTVNVPTGFEKLGYATKVAAGVPVFGAVPHADPAIVFETGKQELTANPVKLEWFNGSVIGENLAHEEMRPQAEYMIKEKWPSYLERDCCTRITFDLVAPSTGDHILSVISTGRALCYVNDQLVFTREQEKDLRLESFYFFKRQLEKRFTYSMTAGQRYSIRLESWATEEHLLAALDWKMFQGSAIRFHEHIDIPRRLEEAADIAKSCDYAVVCVGNINEVESEGFDRETMDLSGEQYKLIQSVISANPKSVVVNFTGAPVTMTQFVDTAPAIVQAWFPGQEAGDSVAAVLSGNVNPSGRLPLSWPKRIEDNSSFGNFPVDSHDILRYEEGLDVGYKWYDRPDAPEPLFPFGFGLSYTTFSLESASILGQDAISDRNGYITVKATVKNTGMRAGKCLVQFYVARTPSDKGYVTLAPLKRLEGVAKVHVEPSETQEAVVQLDKYAVSSYDKDNSCWLAEKGAYQVLVGLSSVDIAHRINFSLPDSFTWQGV